MKRIGILGGTRFIGYHLARTLLEAGHQVILFHRGITLPPEPFPAPTLETYGDRNNPEDLHRLLLRPFDVLFDLSGYTPAHVRPLLAARSRDKVGHYIFCSTSSVYAIPPPCPFAETAPRTLRAGTYGGDKALAEDLLVDEWHKSRWPVTILRPQGVFGPFGPAQAGFVLARISHALPILLSRRRGFKVNFLYVRDLISAFLLVMTSDRSHGKIYNVAGNDILDQPDFIRFCGEASSLEPMIRFFDDSQWHALPMGIPWPDYDLAADNRLIQQDLGLRFTPLTQGLAETWGWLQGMPQQLEPELWRGEAFLLNDRPIPLWLKTWWALDALTASSPIGRRVMALCARFAKPFRRLRGQWRQTRRR